MSTAPNWIEVSPEALAHNYRVLCGSVGPATEILAVIKARGYGHGAESCAPTLVRAGAGWLGVTCADEGVRVREALTAAGLEAEILIMCGCLPQDLPALRRARLTPVVWTAGQVRRLAGSRLRVHVEVDTGMGRQGVRPGADLAALLTTMITADLPPDGLFTHFCSSEEAASELTWGQQRLFTQAVAQVAKAGLRPAWVHAGASSSVDNAAPPGPWLEALAAPSGARAMVRTGLALYGYCLPLCAPDDIALAHQPEPHVQPLLTPVLTWKARVLSVRELCAGETVGYNATFTAAGPMRVALLPVGYADGLRRELSSRSATSETPARAGGWVELHGMRAAILGRISMNLTVVDVTGIPETMPGDVATVLGPGPVAMTANDHARLVGTIAYEILCGIHPCD